jgi:hypothetical protein
VARSFGDLSFTFGTPFQLWQATNFVGGAANPDAAPEADPDHDGLSNVAEYACGTDPHTPNAALVTASLAPEGSNQVLRISVTKNPAATDVEFTVEWTDALTDAPAWSSTGLVVEEDTPASLVVRDSVPAASQPARFYRVRLRVTS